MNGSAKHVKTGSSCVGKEGIVLLNNKAWTRHTQREKDDNIYCKTITIPESKTTEKLKTFNA